LETGRKWNREKRERDVTKAKKESERVQGTRRKRWRRIEELRE